MDFGKSINISLIKIDRREVNQTTLGHFSSSPKLSILVDGGFGV